MGGSILRHFLIAASARTSTRRSRTTWSDATVRGSRTSPAGIQRNASPRPLRPRSQSRSHADRGHDSMPCGLIGHPRLMKGRHLDAHAFAASLIARLRRFALRNRGVACGHHQHRSAIVAVIWVTCKNSDCPLISIANRFYSTFVQCHLATQKGFICEI
jgi:hypothetical protein